MSRLVLRTAFLALGCLVTATYTYVIPTYGFSFQDLDTPWMAANLVDFYVMTSLLSLWIVYKESNVVHSAVWTILLLCFGSVASCAYIFIQFLKLSPQEQSAQDPIYHVLLRHENKSHKEHKGKRYYSSVIAARILFSVVGCLMMAIFIYTGVTDGSPVNKEVFSPWFLASLTSFEVYVFTLAVWVIYKETSRVRAFLWIVPMMHMGSPIICTYIVGQLFQLGSEDPLYLLLLKRSSWDDRVPLLTSPPHPTCVDAPN